MTTKTATILTSKPALWGLAAAALAIPLAMPSAAQADDFKISLNLGGAPYGYHQPVQRVVYKPAPVRQKVVYVKQPTKVVYVDKHHGKKHWKKHDRHDRYDRRVAYYY